MIWGLLGLGVLALSIFKFVLDEIERRLKHAVAAEEIMLNRRRRGAETPDCPICHKPLSVCLKPLVK